MCVDQSTAWEERRKRKGDESAASSLPWPVCCTWLRPRIVFSFLSQTVKWPHSHLSWPLLDLLVVLNPLYRHQCFFLPYFNTKHSFHFSFTEAHFTFLFSSFLIFFSARGLHCKWSSTHREWIISPAVSSMFSYWESQFTFFFLSLSLSSSHSWVVIKEASYFHRLKQSVRTVVVICIEISMTRRWQLRLLHLWWSSSPLSGNFSTLHWQLLTCAQSA